MFRLWLLSGLKLVTLAALVLFSGGLFAQTSDLSDRNPWPGDRNTIGLPDDDEDDDEGGDCPAGLPATGQTTIYAAGDDGDIQAGAALSYTDNGDGTITDNNTGLMWEKKDDAGGDHDLDAIYLWADALAFIDTLNNNMFAGYDDWRLPNANELPSILNHENFLPAVSAEFNMGCVPGCTVLDCSCTISESFYWSSTTLVTAPGLALGVLFNVPFVLPLSKFNPFHVRAVRGGQ